MSTLVWNVDRMDVYTTLGTLTNCVSAIYWTCSGTDVDVNGNTISATQTGNCTVPYNADDPFIEYASLTQDTVLNWVWTYGSDQGIIESVVQDKLNDLMNPVVPAPLPW